MNYSTALLLTFGSILVATVAFWAFLRVKGTHLFFWDLITTKDTSKFQSFQNLLHRLRQADIQIAILEGRIKSLKSSVSEKDAEIGNLNDEVSKLRSENKILSESSNTANPESSEKSITNPVADGQAKNNVSEDSKLVTIRSINQTIFNTDVDLEYDLDDDVDEESSEELHEPPSIESLQKRIAQSKTLITQIPLKFRTMLKSGILNRKTIEKELLDLAELVLNLSSIDKKYREEVLSQCAQDQIGLAITSLSTIDRINKNAVSVKAYITEKLHREYSEEYVSVVRQLAQAA